MALDWTKLAGLLLVLVARLVYNENSVNHNSELRSVVVIIRHGDRVPLQSYPNDPFKDSSFWPVPLGELTDEGKEKVFKLGQWLRNSYAKFLSENYSDNEIFVRSTDFNRTCMSARGVLAGLYSTTDPSLDVSQIPVFTVPRDSDPILFPDARCDQYYVLYEQLYKSPELVNINQKLEGLYAYLSEHTGANIINVENVTKVYDALYCANRRNFTLPSWTSSVFPDQMKRCAEMFFMGKCYNRNLARLKVGPLLNLVIQHFSNIINNTNATQKFQLYSTHDEIIVNVLNSLNLLKNFIPPYASSVLIELRRLNNNFYVNILYRNDTIPIGMTLQNCEFDCPFDKFVDILNPITLTPDEHERECRVLSS